MIKKLYFTVEKETEIGNEEETITGNKTITVYDIVNNEPKLFAAIDCGNEENSKDKIQEYLNDNGYGDDEYALKLL